MQEYRVSDTAQLALRKVLARLSVLSLEELSLPYASTELSPIAFYSKAKNLLETELIEKAAHQLGLKTHSIKVADIARISDLLTDTKLGSISRDQWLGMRAVPVAATEHSIVIAFANPLDLEMQRALAFELGKKIDVRLASEQAILAALSRDSVTSDSEELSELLSSNDAGLAFKGASDETSIYGGSDANSAPVIKVVNRILAEAFERRASDLHLTPEPSGLIVRCRVDGIMKSVLTVPSSLIAPVTSRLKLLAGMDIAERRKPQDGRFRVKAASGSKDVRVSTVPTLYGENVVARFLSGDAVLSSLQDLGMDGLLVEKMKKLLGDSQGLFLVTGPTGSGKSSTLYSALGHLNDGSLNIITIEDPVESRITGITQIQANSKIGLTFAEGLKSVLRQDPDVVMVGEIRDRETAEIALQAAQTGHLVLSTLHANSAAAALTRLVDLGVPPYVVASAVKGILAQRLVRKLCSSCRSTGCSDCDQTGYDGRVGVYSLLEVNSQVAQAIREQKSEREIEATVSDFVPLSHAAQSLVESGITSLEEASRNVGMVEAGAPAAGVKGLEPVSGRRKLLLIEDDENTRAILSLLFEESFFDVVTAENGLEGLDKLHAESPAIVVTDLMMPRMDGLTFIQRMRSDNRTREVPVLLLTAVDSEDKELEIMNGGADDFVSKTSDSRVLLARVNRLLTRAEV